MNKAILLIFVTLGCLNSFSANKSKEQQVIVEIDFGGKQDNQQIAVAWEKGITALEALQKAADVKTHPVAQYVFVTTIGSVEAKRGDMAWYYRINGQTPKKLAISQALASGDTISWRYVKDVCSGKVDVCKK